MNPYSNVNFFEFFSVLFKRITGQIPLSHLAADEIQMLVLIAISVSTGLLGTFLTLRKMTMLANSLSHTTLLGIVICFVFTLQTTLDLNIPLLIFSSIISALLTIVLTEGVRRFFKLHEDASIGLVFTTLFALSILLVTLYTRSSHVGVEVITGNVDALNRSDIFQSFMVASIIIITTLFAYRPWSLTAFDPQLATSSGLKVNFYHYLQMLLTALTLVVSIRAVGVLLVLAFVVAPTLIARQYCNRLHTLLFTTVSIGIFFSLIGIALSRHLLTTTHIPLSTGGLIVTLLSFVYFISTRIKISSGINRRNIYKI